MPKSPCLGRTSRMPVSLSGFVMVEFEHDLPAAAAEAVAVGAVDVQVAPGPFVERVGSRRRCRRDSAVPSRPTASSNGGSGLSFVADAADEPALAEVNQSRWFRTRPPTSRRRVQLGGVERQRVFRPGVVAGQALRAAVERPDLLALLLRCEPGPDRQNVFSAPSAGTRSASVWSSRQAKV